MDVLIDELEQLRLRGYDVRNAYLTNGPLDERSWIGITQFNEVFLDTEMI